MPWFTPASRARSSAAGTPSSPPTSGPTLSGTAAAGPAPATASGQRGTPLGSGGGANYCARAARRLAAEIADARFVSSRTRRNTALLGPRTAPSAAVAVAPAAPRHVVVWVDGEAVEFEMCTPPNHALASPASSTTLASVRGSDPSRSADSVADDTPWWSSNASSLADSGELERAELVRAEREACARIPAKLVRIAAQRGSWRRPSEPGPAEPVAPAREHSAPPSRPISTQPSPRALSRPALTAALAAADADGDRTPRAVATADPFASRHARWEVLSLRDGAGPQSPSAHPLRPAPSLLARRRALTPEAPPVPPLPASIRHAPAPASWAGPLLVPPRFASPGRVARHTDAPGRPALLGRTAAAMSNAAPRGSAHAPGPRPSQNVAPCARPPASTDAPQLAGAAAAGAVAARHRLHRVLGDFDARLYDLSRVGAERRREAHAALEQNFAAHVAPFCAAWRTPPATATDHDELEVDALRVVDAWRSLLAVAGVRPALPPEPAGALVRWAATHSAGVAAALRAFDDEHQAHLAAEA